LSRAPEVGDRAAAVDAMPAPEAEPVADSPRRFFGEDQLRPLHVGAEAVARGGEAGDRRELHPRPGNHRVDRPLGRVEGRLRHRDASGAELELEAAPAFDEADAVGWVQLAADGRHAGSVAGDAAVADPDHVDRVVVELAQEAFLHVYVGNPAHERVARGRRR